MQLRHLDRPRASVPASTAQKRAAPDAADSDRPLRPAHPLGPQPDQVRRLQRLIGNQSVLGLLRGSATATLSEREAPLAAPGEVVHRTISLDTITQDSWKTESARWNLRRSSYLVAIDKAVGAWSHARKGLRGTAADQRAALEDVKEAIKAWRGARRGARARDNPVTELEQEVDTRIASLTRQPQGPAPVNPDVSTPYAQAAADFWRDSSNADKPLRALSDHLLEQVNQHLPVPVVADYRTSGGSSRGQFVAVDWKMALWPTKFSDRSGVTTVGQLNRVEVAEIANVVFHEARHSEQHFRVAQFPLKPGERQRMLPARVLKAARAAPLPAGSKRTTSVRQAQAWSAMFRGSLRTYSTTMEDLNNSTLTLVRTIPTAPGTPMPAGLDVAVQTVNGQLTTLYAELATLQGLQSANGEEQIVIGRIEVIRSLAGELTTAYGTAKSAWGDRTMRVLHARARELATGANSAYKAKEHEVDAHTAGEGARDAVLALTTPTPAPTPTPSPPPTPTPTPVVATSQPGGLVGSSGVATPQADSVQPESVQGDSVQGEAVQGATTPLAEQELSAVPGTDSQTDVGSAGSGRTEMETTA